MSVYFRRKLPYDYRMQTFFHDTQTACIWRSKGLRKNRKRAFCSHYNTSVVVRFLKPNSLSMDCCDVLLGLKSDWRITAFVFSEVGNYKCYFQEKESEKKQKTKTKSWAKKKNEKEKNRKSTDTFLRFQTVSDPCRVYSRATGVHLKHPKGFDIQSVLGNLEPPRVLCGTSLCSSF